MAGGRGGHKEVTRSRQFSFGGMSLPVSPRDAPLIEHVAVAHSAAQLQVQCPPATVGITSVESPERTKAPHGVLN